MRILLVDDDRALSDALTASFRELHYTVDSVEDGEEAWSYGSTFDYDLVILDWMIPNVDGITLCRRFREHGSHVPILLMTARNSCTDKVVGLDSGADDYVIKPFDFEELLARIRALLRRNSDRSALRLTCGKLELDPRSCEVSFDNKPLTLTATEYALLELFLRRKTHTFSIELIVDNLWPSDSYPAKATVRSHIRGLRNKLKKAGATSDVIQTVNGIGYRLQAKPKNLPVTRSTTIVQNTFEQQRERANMLVSVWQKHQSTHLNNLSIVEHFLNSPAMHSQEQANNCRAILHTLSGTLGTFGFTAASQLSAELEELWPTISDEKDLLSDRYLTIIDAIKTELDMPIEQRACSENSANDSADDSADDSGGQHRLMIVGRQHALGQAIQASILSCTSRVEAISMSGLGEVERLFLDQSISNVSLKRRRLHECTILILLPDIVEFEGRNPRISVPMLERLFELVPNLKIFLIQSDTKDRQFRSQARLTRVFTQCEVSDLQALPERILQCFNIVEDDLTVLAIDDDPLFLKGLESILCPSGFNVVTVSDCVDFWSTLSTTNPSLLMLDIEMPYVNGIELCQTIRRHPQWLQLPVIFVSAYTDSDTQHTAFSVGADDYIAKPIEGDRLITRILNRLARVNGYRVPSAA
ncbi:MAG: response regulator [Cyanobacteria bacterium P01_E01_bin.45]